ncbi:MAG: phage antirepressor KilAC domain-containing protein [Clostridium sp.]|nr:phage antirepressor KilAC domain-containing protein [Clostridium sp.]
MRENEILESLKTREELIGRTEVLDKVKELLLLPNTEYATTQQVADYFEVPETTIKEQLQNNKDEFDKDGYNVLVKEELKVIKITCGIKSRAKSLAIFPKRAILRMAMLLRDSEVAKEIRTRLLDIVQDASEGKDNIIDNIVDEIDEEKILSERLTQAIMSGDIEEEGRIKTEIIGLRNKRIKKLQNEIETITTNALTVTQIAKDYGMSAQELNKILSDEKIQYCQRGQWLLYAKYQDKGYTKSNTVTYKHKNGSIGSKLNTKWTQKGRLFINDILKKNGIIAIMDREQDKVS